MARAREKRRFVPPTSEANRRDIFFPDDMKGMRIEYAPICRYTNDRYDRHYVQGLRNKSVNRSVLPVTVFLPTS